MDLRSVSVLFILVVVTSAAPEKYAQYQEIKDYQPTGYGIQAVEDDKDHYHEDSYGPAEYEFKYGVHDVHTGDIKSHQEERKGDVVHGRYELIDSDGFRRIVEYTADDQHGFQAIVRREPTDIKIPIPEHHKYEESVSPSYPDPHKYYVASTSAPLVHYSPSGYSGSGIGSSSGSHSEHSTGQGFEAATGYSADLQDELTDVGLKYKH